MNQLIILASGRGDGLPPDIDRHIAAEIEAMAGPLGLEPHDGKWRDGGLELADGRRIVDDEWLALDVPADLQSVRLATGALLTAIAHRHGKGKVWSPVQLVHIVRPHGKDSDPVHNGRCRLRTVYVHEAATPRSVAPLEKLISDHVRRGHRPKEYRVHPRDLTDMAQRLGAKVTYVGDARPAPLSLTLGCNGIPAHVVTDESVPPGTFGTTP